MADIKERVRAARMVAPAPGSGVNGSGPLDLPLARLARNDIGNAERFRQRVGADFLYLQEGNWLAWDGNRWDGTFGPVEAQKAAQSVAIAIREEANALDIQGPEFEAVPRGELESEKLYLKRIEKEHADRVAALRRHANSSGNTGKLAGMLAETAPHLTVARDAMDANPWAVNVQNGTLELVPPRESLGDGEWPWRLRAAAREDRITKIAGAAYKAAWFGDAFDFAALTFAAQARAPTFHAFLARVQPQAAMREYLQRLAGYLLTGDTGEQELFLNIGRGANGKGTFFEALAYVLGDYAAVLPIEAIRHQDGNRGSGPRPEIARLPGRRFVRISEADENERLSEGLVKKLTGQDVLEVRDLFKGVFEFSPQFKIVLYVNDKPAIRGKDDGIWRRIRLIEWQVQIPKDARDRNLLEKLKSEADGILAWALAGFAMWRQEGLAPPQAVEDATDAYRVERDPLLRFIDFALEPWPSGSCGASELYRLYQLWCKTEALDPLTQTGFGRQMNGRAVETFDGTTAVIEKSKSGTIEYRNVAVRAGVDATLRAALAAQHPINNRAEPDEYGGGP
jgi:putative DNA primase/helicase